MGLIKFNDAVLSLLEIIEDKRRPKFSEKACYILIVIFLSQLAGYMMNNYAKKALIENAIIFLSRWLEISPVTFLLFFLGNDFLTILFFLIFQVTIYSFFFYIALLGILRQHRPDLLLKIKSSAFHSNYSYSLNVFFNTFLWVFYTPYIELNSGIFSCGNNSFLTAYRGDNGCTSHPFYLKLFGIIGLILTFLTGLTIIVFYRSYEFLDTNLLKKKFNMLAIYQLIARTLVVVIYYLDLSEVLVKHICSQILWVLLVLEFAIYLPLKNKNVLRFYGSSLFLYSLLMFLAMIWERTEIFSEYNLFFFFMLMAPLLVKSSSLLIDHQYNNLICMNISSFQKKIGEDRDFSKLDVFLEEMLHLAGVSLERADEKLRFFGMMETHKEFCRDKHCYCRDPEFDYKDENSNIKVEKIIVIIGFLFRKALPQVKTSQIREHLSLKYLSFLAVYQDNPVRAYFELNILLMSKESRSTFFVAISEIISKNIEKMISEVFRETDGFTDSLKGIQDISVQSFIEVEQQKVVLRKQILNVLKTKQDYWASLLRGSFDSLDILYQYVYPLKKETEKLKKMLNISRINLDQDRSLSLDKNVYYLKFLSVYFSIITNNHYLGVRCERMVMDMRLKDHFSTEEKINASHITKGDVLCIIVSFLNQKGRILNNKGNIIMAQFFGFRTCEQFDSQIHSFTDLMPKTIADSHDKFVKAYIERGRSKIIKKSFINFASDNEGFAFPVKIHLDHNFNFQNQFAIAGVLLKIRENAKYIIFDLSGRICSLTKRAYLQLWEFSEYPLKSLLQLNICFLIPKIRRLIFSDNEPNGEGNQEVLTEQPFSISNETSSIFLPLNPAVIEPYSHIYGADLLANKRQHHNFANSIPFDNTEIFTHHKVNFNLFLNVYSEKSFKFYILEILAYKRDVESVRPQQSKVLEVLPSYAEGMLSATIADVKLASGSYQEEDNASEIEDDYDNENGRESEDHERELGDKNRKEKKNSKKKEKEGEGDSIEEAAKGKIVYDDESENEEEEESEGIKEGNRRVPEGSVSSSIQSSYLNSFREIQEILNKRRVPFIMKTLYGFEIVKLLVFLIINVAFVLISRSLMSDFKSQLSELSSSTFLADAYAHSYFSLQLEENFALFNSSSSAEATNLHLYELQLLNISFSDFQAKYSEELRTTISFDYQKYYLDTLLAITDGTRTSTYVSNLNLPQFLRKVLERQYQALRFSQQINLLDYKNLDGFEFENYATPLDFFAWNYSELISITNNYLNKVVTYFLDENNFLLIFGLLCCFFVIFLYVLIQLGTLPLYYRLFNKMDSVFLGATRVTEGEGNLERILSSTSLENISSETDQYMMVDFPQMVNSLYSTRRAEFLSMDESQKDTSKTMNEGKNKMMKTLAKKLNRSTGNTKKSGKSGDGRLSQERQNAKSGKILNEKIKNQFLSKFGLYLSYLISFTVVSIYFVILIIFYVNLTKKINEDVDNLESFSRLSRAINAVLVESDILISNQYDEIMGRSPRLSSAQFDKISNLLKANIVYVNSDFKGLSELSSNFEHSSSSVDQLIYATLNKDACQLFPYANEQSAEFSRETCKDVWLGALSLGLTNSVSKIMYLTQSFEKLIFGETKALTDFKQYFESQEVKEKLKFYYFFQTALRRFIVELLNKYREEIEQLMMQFSLIVGLGCAAYALIFILVIYIFFKSLENRYFSSLFLLYLLPYKKVINDQYIQILFKRLNNF